MSVEHIRKETAAGAICIGYQLELLAEVDRLRTYEKAIKDSHNGYDEGTPSEKPATPQQAIAELIEEATEMGRAEGKVKR